MITHQTVITRHTLYINTLPTMWWTDVMLMYEAAKARDATSMTVPQPSCAERPQPYTCHTRFLVRRCSFISLHWRHNEPDGVSNHQPNDCLFNRLFRRRSDRQNITAPRHWPLCGEFTGDRWIPRTLWPVTWKMFPLDDVIMFFPESWKITPIARPWERRMGRIFHSSNYDRRDILSHCYALRNIVFDWTMVYWYSIKCFIGLRYIETQ